VFEKIKSYLNVGFDFYGIEAFDSDETTYFQVTQIKKRKEELVIVNEQVFTSWKKLIANLSIIIPVHLSYNTTKVLDKVIAKNKDSFSENLIYQVFPNLDLSRFYFNIALFENDYYLAITEKTELDTLIQKFTEAKILIASAYIGTSSIVNISPYRDNDTFITNCKKLDLSTTANSHERLTKGNFFKKPHAPYDLNGLNVATNAILCFSSVLTYFLPGKKINTNYLELSNSLDDNAKYERRFKALLWPIIGFFLTLLLINFIVFNHYYSKLETLNQNVALNISNKEKLVTLKEDVNIKESRVVVILGNKNSKSTFFLDEITSSIPNTVLLTALTFQPLLKPLRTEKPIEQDLKTVLIEGETSNSDDFSTWIATIENFSWIKSVETMEYGFQSKNSSFFTLKLTIDEE
jgi:Tfp pilus assembly protein PilN